MTNQTDPFDIVFQAGSRAKKTIALAEGSDPRVVEGALKAQAKGHANIILVGGEAAVQAELDAQNAPDGVRVIDPATSDLSDGFADTYHQMRAAKGMTAEQAALDMRDPRYFAAMLVREGHADGSVGGAVASTADTVRAALKVIGKAKTANLVSSFFLMLPPPAAHPGREIMLFSDCGLVVDPDAESLADIALTSANSFGALTGQTPKVAMLSFSTKGSAEHPAVTKVCKATVLAQTAKPDLIIDGELQFDAAFMPSVAASKAPRAALQGDANVFIFPNLDAGNIGYKIAQRIGGADAIGPVLQGLAKPANDLSRGCTAEDVYRIIGVTAAQAQDR